MDKRDMIIDQVIEKGFLPLFYQADPETCLALTDALYGSGIRVLEFTNRGPLALRNFEFLRNRAATQWPGLLLGAGTIKDAAAARDFFRAGADFLVSPGIPEDVFDLCYSEKILWIPGCMTVSEIIQAEKYGLTLIKLFPGNILGPGFVRAIREIFPNQLFMPTGGVELDKENLREWFGAGVAAVGMGSRLFLPELLARRDFARIGRLTAEALALIREIRQGGGSPA